MAGNGLHRLSVALWWLLLYCRNVKGLRKALLSFSAAVQSQAFSVGGRILLARLIFEHQRRAERLSVQIQRLASSVCWACKLSGNASAGRETLSVCPNNSVTLALVLLVFGLAVRAAHGRLVGSVHFWWCIVPILVGKVRKLIGQDLTLWKLRWSG
jgi:hypothetical protein